VSDLRLAEYNTFGRHIKKLSRILHSETLEHVSTALLEGVEYLHAKLAPIDPPRSPDDAADLGEDSEIRIVLVKARKQDEGGNFIE
jgi:hypothetical protein